MAWTAPMTAVAGNVFTAAQFNTYVRDNLLETAPAKATAGSQIIVSTAANSVVARTPTWDWTLYTESTTSQAWADMPTYYGPDVTVTIGTKALVFLYCCMSNSGSYSCNMSFALSGANTLSPSLQFSIAVTGTGYQRVGAVFPIDDQTPGSTNFVAKYIVGNGTGTFMDRMLGVIPL